MTLAVDTFYESLKHLDRHILVYTAQRFADVKCLSNDIFSKLVIVAFGLDADAVVQISCPVLLHPFLEILPQFIAVGFHGPIVPFTCLVPDPVMPLWLELETVNIDSETVFVQVDLHSFLPKLFRRSQKTTGVMAMDVNFDIVIIPFVVVPALV